MFERLMGGLPCARRDADSPAAAWKRVTWRGQGPERGQGQCVHLCGNHRAVREGSATMAWRVLGPGEQHSSHKQGSGNAGGGGGEACGKQ